MARDFGIVGSEKTREVICQKKPDVGSYSVVECVGAEARISLVFGNVRAESLTLRFSNRPRLNITGKSTNY